MSAMVFVGGLMVSSVPYCNAKKLKKQNINKIKFYGLTGFIFLAGLVYPSLMRMLGI